MALLIPFFVLRLLEKGARRRLLAVLGIAMVIGGQIAVGGRGGLLAAATVVILGLAVRFTPQAIWTGLLAAAMVSIPLLILIPDEPTSYASADPPSTTLDRLNELSTGRIQLVGGGWSLFSEDPLIGQGFGRDDVFLGSVPHQVHVTWLRMAVQGGILLPLVMLLLVARVGRLAWQNYSRAPAGDRYAHMATGLVFLLGIAGSFVEPSAIAGAFHGAALWWAAAGTATSIASRHDSARKGQQGRYWLETSRATSA